MIFPFATNLLGASHAPFLLSYTELSGGGFKNMNAYAVYLRNLLY
jgi:hypothetical protein